MFISEYLRPEDSPYSPMLKNCRNCIWRYIWDIKDPRKRRILVIQEICIAVKTMYEQSVYNPSCYIPLANIMRDFGVDDCEEIWNAIPGAGLHGPYRRDISAEIIAFVVSITHEVNSIMKK